MRLYDEKTIEDLMRAILDDEFDDMYQNEDAYGGSVSGWDVLFDVFRRRVKEGMKVLDLGCGSGELFGKLPITHGVEPNRRRYEAALDEAKEYGIDVRRGVAEAIPFDNEMFDVVLMWGTWCFLRSWDEALVQVNRVLKEGSLFMFDYYTETTLPIAKTNDEANLIQRLRLFGFEVVERGGVLTDVSGRRKYVVVEKVRDFDWRWLRLPQVVGKINNYLEERDWWMR